MTPESEVVRGESFRLPDMSGAIDLGDDRPGGAGWLRLSSKLIEPRDAFQDLARA